MYSQDLFYATSFRSSYRYLTTYLKYGWLGDMVICNTSLVMSSSEKASFRLSDRRITWELNNTSSRRLQRADNRVFKLTCRAEQSERMFSCCSPCLWHLCCRSQSQLALLVPACWSCTQSRHHPPPETALMGNHTLGSTFSRLSIRQLHVTKGWGKSYFIHKLKIFIWIVFYEQVSYLPGAALPPKMLRQSSRTVRLIWKPTKSSLIVNSWKMSAWKRSVAFLSLKVALHFQYRAWYITKHTWMKALACKHFESSTVTFRPLGVALKIAWSLKAIAFNMFDRLRALSRLATNTFCSSGCDWVDRGIVLLK